MIAIEWKQEKVLWVGWEGRQGVQVIRSVSQWWSYSSWSSGKGGLNLPMWDIILIGSIPSWILARDCCLHQCIRLTNLETVGIGQSSSSCAREGSFMLPLAFWCEYIPEAQGFVSCSTAYHRPVWVNSHMEDPRCMSTELFHPGHIRVLP